MSNIRVDALPLGTVIPIRYDFIFSDMFNNEKNIDIIEVFISHYLCIPLSEVKNHVRIKNRELFINNKKERSKQVDLMLDYKGEKINVEINNDGLSKGIIERNIVYACHVHGTQLKYGDNNYSNIKRTIQINFTKNEKESENERELYFFTNGNGKVLSKKIEIDLINIDKYADLWYSGTDDAISMWCKLLNASTKEEITSIMESEIMQSVPEETREKLLDEIDKYSEDEEYIGLYNISSKQECARNSILHEAKEEAAKEGREEGFKEGIEHGIEQGIQQGIEHKTKEDALNLHDNGVSKEIICKSLGISEEEFDSYLDC